MYIDIFGVFSFAEPCYLWTLKWASCKETPDVFTDKT